MKVAVFGATGVQGKAQLHQLRRSGHEPVAVVRNPAGVEGACVRAELTDRDSIVSALHGIDAVFLNLPSTTFQVAAPLIAAAQTIAQVAAASSSVRMLVFNTSMPVAEQKLGFSSQDARWDMRARIFASGVPAVSIQPVVYLDNLLNAWAWPHIVKGILLYPHLETLDVSWICHDDLASLMIAALERPHLSGRAFAVGGPEAVRGPVLARRLSATWGRPLRFVSQSVPDYCASMVRVFEGRASLDPHRLSEELGRMYDWYNTAPERPFYVDMKPVLELLPAQLTSIEEWAARQTLPA